MLIKFENVANGGVCFIPVSVHNSSFIPSFEYKQGEYVIPGLGIPVLKTFSRKQIEDNGRPKNCIDMKTGRLYYMKPEQDILVLEM